MPSLARIAGDRVTVGASAAMIAVIAGGTMGSVDMSGFGAAAAVPALAATAREWSERRKLRRHAAQHPYWPLRELRKHTRSRL